ncbi:hypothetical protein BC628DRAFT_45178 [Trametes gibbosa]|nr:hypothetical protein BC628DRAFT_45178 [Trametes gibbosa]
MSSSPRPPPAIHRPLRLPSISTSATATATYTNSQRSIPHGYLARRTPACLRRCSPLLTPTLVTLSSPTLAFQPAPHRGARVHQRYRLPHHAMPPPPASSPSACATLSGAHHRRCSGRAPAKLGHRRTPFRTAGPRLVLPLCARPRRALPEALHDALCAFPRSHPPDVARPLCNFPRAMPPATSYLALAQHAVADDSASTASSPENGLHCGGPRRFSLLRARAAALSDPPCGARGTPSVQYILRRGRRYCIRVQTPSGVHFQIVIVGQNPQLAVLAPRSHPSCHAPRIRSLARSRSDLLATCAPRNSQSRSSWSLIAQSGCRTGARTCMKLAAARLGHRARFPAPRQSSLTLSSSQ